jgi:flagellar secretion chaperone FliS
MLNRRAFAEYQQTSAVGASALGQIVALYGRILRDFGCALEAFEGGNIETRVAEINHALLIVGELQGVLDFERGGAAAKQLDDFYNVTRAEILKVSVAPSREGFERLIGLFAPMYKAWYKISEQLPATPAREAVRETRVKMSAPPAATTPAAKDEESQKPAAVWRG